MNKRFIWLASLFIFWVVIARPSSPVISSLEDAKCIIKESKRLEKNFPAVHEYLASLSFDDRKMFDNFLTDEAAELRYRLKKEVIIYDVGWVVAFAGGWIGLLLIPSSHEKLGWGIFGGGMLAAAGFRIAGQYHVFNAEVHMRALRDLRGDANLSSKGAKLAEW